MTEDIVYLEIFLLGMVAGVYLAVSMMLGGKWFKRHIADEAPSPIVRDQDGTIYFDANQVTEVKMAGADTPFDVTGKPRAVPWHIRKKQLEEAHRTKRRRLESFRDLT